MIKKALIITLLVVLVAFATCMTASAFNLKIDGVYLSSDSNVDDLFGDGVYSFDRSTKTLTVHKSPSNPRSIICDDDGLILNIVADVTLGDIYFKGTGTIIGPGTLTAEYIDPFSDLVIQNTRVTAIGIGHDESKRYGDLWIANSYVNANFGKFTSINQSGCSMVAPSDYSIQYKYGFVGNEQMQYCAIINSHGVISCAPAVFAPWGQFDLIIAGTTVTAKNQNDILGNGCFSYDPASKTLTVSDSYNSEYQGSIIDSRVESLTINVSSSRAELNSYSSCQIRLYATTELTGGGALFFKQSTLPAIEVRNGADLILTDIKISAMDTVRSYSITGSGGALEITNSALYLRGNTAAVSGFREISLYDCDLTYPGTSLSGGDFHDANGIAKYIVVKPSEQYDLKVMGEQITSTNCDGIRGGVNAYDPENKILYIRDDLSASTSNTLIDSGIEGLTIRFEGSITLVSNHADYPAIVLRADTTITGERLTLKNTAGIEALRVENGEGTGIHLNIENISLNISGGFGIISNPFGASLSFTGADVNISASGLSNSGAVAGFTGGITFDSCEITKPTGASVNASNGAIYADGTAAREVMIAGGYELYIDDIRVTRENMSDVTGGGVFAYDPVDKTLSIHGNYAASSADTLIYNMEIDGLIIKVTEASTLEAPISCIYANAATTLTGGAKLSLKAEEKVVALDDCYLTLDAAELVLEGDYGIYGYNGRLSIADSNLEIKSNYEAIGSMDGSPMTVELIRETIVSPSGATLTGGSTKFTDINGNAVKELHLACANCYQIEYAFVDYEESPAKLKVMLSAQPFAPDAILVAAFYDANGRFIGASIADIDKSTTDVSLDNHDGSFKIFVCDAVAKQPLADPYPVK